MPKKIRKHNARTSIISTNKSPVNDRNFITHVNHLKNIKISVDNAKRWDKLKKQIGFITDDDLVIHLLDLADSDRQNNICKTIGQSQSNENDSNKLGNDKYDDDDNNNNDNNEIFKASVNKSGENNKLTMTHYYKNKSKRKNKIKHEDKHNIRKKFKKNKDNNNSINLNDDDTSMITNNIVKLHNEFDICSNEDESVIRKTDKLDQTVFVNDLDTKENIIKNDKNSFKNDNNDDIKKVTNLLPSASLALKKLNKDNNDYNNCNFNYEQDIHSINNNNNNKNESSKENIDSKITHKKRKYLNDNDSRESKVIVISDNDKKEHQQHQLLQNNEKQDRKQKHKYSNDIKKNHDVKKVPQNDMISNNLDKSKLIFESFEDKTLLSSVNADNHSSNELITTATICDEPRLGIKICSSCNSNHVQSECPLLLSPVRKISDIITYQQWLKKYLSNEEVMEAVTMSSKDPISEGYGLQISNSTSIINIDNPDNNDDDDDDDNDDDDYDDDFGLNDVSDNESIKASSVESKSNIILNNKEKKKKLLITTNKEIDKRPLYSRESLPECLEFKITKKSDHGIGIFAKNLIPIYVEFGPLVGINIKEMDIPDDFPMRHIWEIILVNNNNNNSNNNDKKICYISTTNPLKSNWIRYMRPADNKDERNIAVVNKNNKLYFISMINIKPGIELTYWIESQSTAWMRKNKNDKTNCGGCNLNFSHSIYYRLHCCIFHDINYSLTIRKYHCKVCGAAVLGKDNIMKHASELHFGRGAYQCQYCKKFFLRLNYLEMHRTYGCAKNPQRSRPLCDFCGRKFCQPQKLKVHIKRMHSDISEVLNEFQCKSCLKLLGSRAALQRHMKEVHHKDVVGAATCDRCGKIFQNKSNLKIHMLTHSGVKPFKCKEDDCKAAFTTKQCLQFHYKKVHGLTEEMMPKIERSVAYTFNAYSGRLVEDNNSSNNTIITNTNETLKLNQNNYQDKTEDSLKNDITLNEFQYQYQEQQRPHKNLAISHEELTKSDLSLIKSCIEPQQKIKTLQEPSPLSHTKLINNRSAILTINTPILSTNRHHDHMNFSSSSSSSNNNSNSNIGSDISTSRFQSKGSKKWIGEFNLPLTKITKHITQSTANSTENFLHNEFSSDDDNDYQDSDDDNDINKNKKQSKLSQQTTVDDSKLIISSIYERTESTNASLLVEAALDAAERDIGTVAVVITPTPTPTPPTTATTTITAVVHSSVVDYSNRDQNFYSTISNRLQSPVLPLSPPPPPSSSLLISRSPTITVNEHNLKSYIQQQQDIVMFPLSTTLNNDHHQDSSSPNNVNSDFNSHHRLMDCTNTGDSVKNHNVDPYLHPHHHHQHHRHHHHNLNHNHHDNSESLCNSSTNSYNQLLSTQPLTTLSSTASNSRYLQNHHHNYRHHDRDHRHQVSTENLSSDENDTEAQNLTISVKEKTLQLDLSTSYKYDSLDLDLNRDINTHNKVE